MLYKVKTLKGYKLDSLDGAIGGVEDLYFDDLHWTIRYLVADTGHWLKGRKVLISPYALFTIDPEKHQIAINLRQKEIEDSPSLESDEPVSKQFEEAYYSHYGWPFYWGGPLMWGPFPTIHFDPEEWLKAQQLERSWDPHLRSTRAVSGYHILAQDGEVGHVDDFILDDTTWAIRYLVIDTRNWWPGKKVLIAPEWIERVSWSESQVVLKISRERIQGAPEYSEEALVTRDYEDMLHRHYDRQGYWMKDPAPHVPMT